MQPETAMVDGDGNMNAGVPPSMPGGLTQANLVNSATGAAGALAGWAISSLGRKVKIFTSYPLTSHDNSSQLAPSEMQSAIANTIDRPTSTQPVNDISTSASPAMGLPPNATSSLASSSRSKGLQLGSNKGNANSVAAQVAAQVAAEEGGALWGSDDLMDVNADEGDWSEFFRQLNPSCLNKLLQVRSRAPQLSSFRNLSQLLVSVSVIPF
jgi:SCY1-like protein 1